MYFWDINALAKELREDTVSHNEQVKYYIAATLIYMFSARIPEVATHDNPRHAALFSAMIFGLKLVVVIWGILYSYRFNKQGDDKEFQVRFVALSLPATMRYILLTILIVLPLTALIHILIVAAFSVLDQQTRQALPHVLTLTKFSYNMLLLILSIGYYKYLSKKMKYVAGIT